MAHGDTWSICMRHMFVCVYVCACVYVVPAGSVVGCTYLPDTEIVVGLLATSKGGLQRYSNDPHDISG